MAAEARPIDWKSLRIGMLGGDRREQEIARLAAATGADVRAYGFPCPEGGISCATYLRDPSAVLDKAKFALFPSPHMATYWAFSTSPAHTALISARSRFCG